MQHTDPAHQHDVVGSRHNIEMWGELGERAARDVRKGTQVQGLGRLRAEGWTDREGKKRTANKISVNDMFLITESLYHTPPQVRMG